MQMLGNAWRGHNNARGMFNQSMPRFFYFKYARWLASWPA